MPKQPSPSTSQRLAQIIKTQSPFTKLGKQLDTTYKFKPLTSKQQFKNACHDMTNLKEAVEEQLHPFVQTIKEEMADLKETIFNLQVKFEQTAPCHYMHPEHRDMRKCTVTECFAMFQSQNAKCDGCIRLFDCTVQANETTRLHLKYQYYESYDATWSGLYLCPECAEKFLDFKFDPEYLLRKGRFSSGYLMYDKYIDHRNQILADCEELDLLGVDLGTFLLDGESKSDDVDTEDSEGSKQRESVPKEYQTEVYRILNAATADVLNCSPYHQPSQ